MDAGPDAFAPLSPTCEAAFDALVRLAARQTGCPVAWLCLIEQDRCWIQTAHGVAPGALRVRHRLFAELADAGQPLVVPDTLTDARCAQDPVLAGTPVPRFFAAVPVQLQGRCVAALCVVHHRPGSLGEPALQALGDLALACSALLETAQRDAQPLQRLPHDDTHAAWETYAGMLQRHAPGAAVPQMEALLHKAVEELGAGVMVSAPDGRILLANAHWRTNLGPLLPADCTHWPDAVRHMARAGLYAQATGREEAFVAWRLSLPGANARPHEVRLAERWLLISDHRLSDGNVVHLSVDISPLKHAQAELVEQQARQRDTDARTAAVLRAVPDLWFIVDRDGRYSECSDLAHPSLLQPFSELQGRRFEEVLPPGVAEPALAAVHAAAAQQTLQRLEYELQLPDGRMRHFEARVAPIVGGETLYLTRDMTDWHDLAREARQSEERWKFALEGAGQAVWDWDGESGRVFYSRRWKEMFGYAEHEIGDSLDEWRDRVHPEDYPRLRDEIIRYHAGENPTCELDYRMRHRDGHEMWIRERGKIVDRLPDGRAKRVVGTHSDITRQKLAEQALRDKQAAELASRSKTEFLSRMSHEMRTPLNAVIGFAQLLRLQSGVRLDHVDHVLHAGQHLLALINDVLDLQQVEAGRLTLKIEPVELEPLLVTCSALLEPLALARGVIQRVQVAGDLHVLADEQRLRQVLLNLGSNAIKYNRPAGRVNWTVHTGPDAVSVLVEDTGSGMNVDDQARLFQPFERLGRETSSIEGSGLGLLIARRLVEEMGGRVRIESQVGVGTRMRVELPWASPLAIAETEPLAAPARRRRLLYVEDNRINALLFEETLRMHTNVDLRIAEDGDEALEMARNAWPDVLVLDANLPGLSGYEVLEQLRLVPGLATVPAFMCSADAMPEDVARARAAGFRGYWTKPLDIQQVLADLQALDAPQQ
jgi:PAS domain S-box-containing protein